MAKGMNLQMNFCIVGFYKSHGVLW
jgi:hypothetical protein